MTIRPVRYRDLPALKRLFSDAFTAEYERRGVELTSQFGRLQQMYPVVRALALFPNPYQYALNLLVAEVGGQVAGFVQTSPGYQSRSRWNIDYLAVAPALRGQGIARALLENVFQVCAPEGVRGYTMAVDVRNQPGLALCGQLGFRHYATVGYYQAPAELVGATEPSPPPAGLRPMRPKDAPLLAGLYEASTPGGVRLVDSRTPADFEVGLVERTVEVWRRQMRECEEMRYVIDGHDKTLTAYLRILGQYRGETPHTVQVAVHPGYTDLVAPLLQFALGKLRGFPAAAALSWSADYHPQKKAAYEEFGLQLVTEDVLLVRDTMMALKLPIQAVKGEELPAFKPAFFG
ncbi:MAG: GNAT family N-acetyltransferase [Candidatus Sericytochromatia bacterium]|nr:GNAT family N-acetyltransferase [Candidatus Tanganyikabacteria bacterium]